MFVLALSFFLASCGQKKDEALVTDFNSKKTDADKMITTMQDAGKMMMSDHAAWNAKLDSVAKLPGADTAKINGFKSAMKQMEDMTKPNAMMDSLKAYSNAKTETNDQLKAAIAGLDANLSMCKSSCDMMMDQHKKLGADIMAFLGSNTAPTTDAKAGEMKSAKKATTTPQVDNSGMDISKHPVKPVTTGTARRSSGSTIKQ